MLQQVLACNAKWKNYGESAACAPSALRHTSFWAGGQSMDAMQRSHVNVVDVDVAHLLEGNVAVLVALGVVDGDRLGPKVLVLLVQRACAPPLIPAAAAMRPAPMKLKLQLAMMPSYVSSVLMACDHQSKAAPCRVSGTVHTPRRMYPELPPVYSSIKPGCQRPQPSTDCPPGIPASCQSEMEVFRLRAWMLKNGRTPCSFDWYSPSARFGT